MNNHDRKILEIIKQIVSRLSPNGETYSPEELAQEFAEEILDLREVNGELKQELKDFR